MIWAPDAKGLWRFKLTSFWQRRCRTQEAGLMPIPTRGIRQVGVGMMGGGFGRTGRVLGSDGRDGRQIRVSFFGFMSGLPERSPSDLLMGKSLGSFAANDVVFLVNFGLSLEKTENQDTSREGAAGKQKEPAEGESRQTGVYSERVGRGYRLLENRTRHGSRDGKIGVCHVRCLRSSRRNIFSTLLRSWAKCWSFAPPQEKHRMGGRS